MSRLEIALLGGLRLRHPNRGSIELAGEKGAQLLARLAYAPGTRYRRDALQALLWPDSDPPHAQGNLRFVLHQLRAMLGGNEGPLRSDSRAIWLDPDRVSVDVVRFESLAAEGTLEALAAACDLYGSDLLSNAVGLSPEYEDWLLPERERLRDLARSAFWNLFSLRLWRGEVMEAKACAQRYLGIDPYCERMHAALMRLHLTQGERALAAGRYGQLRARLAHDLQIRPGAEVEQLARAVSQAPGRSAPEPFNAAWVLGRSDVPSDGKPLVAVLPFRDLSEDQTLVSLPAALTEDVIADLARFRRLGVLARHTSFALGHDPDPEARLRQLGARYTVEGSVRRTGNRLSVTVRLVDNTSQRQLWGERYQGDWDELPSFQEEAAKAIVATIPVQVEQAELERVRHRAIQSLSAYEHCLRGREHQRSITYASHAKALEHFSRALEQDPASAAAHCGLAVCHVSTGGIAPVDEDRRREQAIGHAQQAIALDPLDPQGHWLLGMLLQMRRDFSGARFHLDRAMTLSPGDVETLGYTGLEYAYAGEPERGIGQAERSIRLNPYFPPVSAEQIGKACLVGRRYEEALFWLRQTPDRITSNRGWLAAAAAYAGRADEAAMHARLMRTTLQQRLGEEQLRAVGGPIGWLRLPARFQYPSDLEHYVRGLEMAGLG
jgi:DNA-binding SARP family transcriptional activator/TolB-like protein/Tfp pilus assembly protein PilF